MSVAPGRKYVSPHPNPGLLQVLTGGQALMKALPISYRRSVLPTIYLPR